MQFKLHCIPASASATSDLDLSELSLPALGSTLSDDGWPGGPDLDVLAGQPNNPVQTVLIF